MNISELRFKTTPPDHIEKCLLDGIILCEAIGDDALRFRLAYALSRLEPGQLTFDQANRLTYSQFAEFYNNAIQNLIAVTRGGECCSNPNCVHARRTQGTTTEISFDTEPWPYKLTPDDEAKLKGLQW